MRDADPRARPLHVVHDQIGSPTYTADVCDQTLALLKSRLRGTVHATSEGQCTWYEFAQEIARAAQAPVSITPCTTEEFPRPARRPASSVLENARLKQHELNRMPDWRAGFERFLEDERAAGTSATSPS
jgi:dTDP-4-dehydrorhamnose reductase